MDPAQIQPVLFKGKLYITDQSKWLLLIMAYVTQVTVSGDGGQGRRGGEMSESEP